MEGWPLPNGDNPMSEAAARRRDRFDSLDQAYENYRSKPPLDQLHPDALRAYVDGGFSPAPDGSVTLRCRPSTEAEVFRHAAASGAWSTITSIEMPVAVVAGRPEGVGPGAFAPTTAETLPTAPSCAARPRPLRATGGPRSHGRTTWPAGSEPTIVVLRPGDISRVIKKRDLFRTSRGPAQPNGSPERLGPSVAASDGEEPVVRKHRVRCGTADLGAASRRSPAAVVTRWR